MKKLLNIIGSALIGLSALTNGYAQEKAISLSDYPDYFAETIDGVGYFLTKHTPKKSSKSILYLKVTSPGLSERREIYWDNDSDGFPEIYEDYGVIFEFGSKKEKLIAKRNHKEITAEDHKKYNEYLIIIGKVVKAEKEKRLKEQEKEKNDREDK
ncbi:MAG: hypothetical protein RL557_8 [archaeon]